MPIPEGTISTSAVWQSPEVIEEPELVEEVLPEVEADEVAE